MVVASSEDDAYRIITLDSNRIFSIPSLSFSCLTLGYNTEHHFLDRSRVVFNVIGQSNENNSRIISVCHHTEVME